MDANSINRPKKGKSSNKYSNTKKQTGSNKQPATGNEQSQKDIFIEIEPSSMTNLLVTDQARESQQVGSNSATNQTMTTQHVESEVSPDSDDHSNLPDTLTKLTTPNGSEVFLIGSAHFSLKSVQEVQKVIRTVKPSAVILELCNERGFMLAIDEQELLEMNRRLSFENIRSAIAQKGLAQGLIYIMFIKMSASLTEKLGLAPGSEFRAGATEARKIPGCSVILGDRSLKVTVARAVASISLWQKMKLIYQVMANDTAITQEDVEKCKEKDILEQLLQELGGEYPGFKRVLLDERNVYLAHSIYQWAQHSETSNGPQKIVAIVGVGHVAGIIENWGKTTDDEIKLLNEIPETSRTRRVVTKTIKYCSIVLLLYVGYRAITPNNVQTAIHNRLTGR